MKVPPRVTEEVARMRRGPKPALDREQILAKGIALADAEGLESLTMQRLAEAFGFTPMSLYRYFRNKAELLDGMIETVLARPATPGKTRGWRSDLEQWARVTLASFTGHPWLLDATSRARTMGPNELAWAGLAVRSLAEAGLTPADQHGAFLALIGHVRSAAEFVSHPPRFPEETQAPASSVLASPGQGFNRGLRIILEGITAAARNR